MESRSQSKRANSIKGQDYKGHICMSQEELNIAKNESKGILGGP
jgi:hypothetical protein